MRSHKRLARAADPPTRTCVQCTRASRSRLERWTPVTAARGASCWGASGGASSRDCSASCLIRAGGGGGEVPWGRLERAVGSCRVREADSCRAPVPPPPACLSKRSWQDEPWHHSTAEFDVSGAVTDAVSGAGGASPALGGGTSAWTTTTLTTTLAAHPRRHL